MILSPTLKSLFRRIIVALFIVCLPLFCLSTTIRWAFNSPDVYVYGFEKYQITTATGIDEKELAEIAETIIEYWNSDTEFLEVFVGQFPLFNEREIIHMKDVKDLVDKVYLTQMLSLSAILILGALGFFRLRMGFVEPLAYRVFLSGLFGALTIVIVSIALAIGFPWFFHFFHVISFTNDFWQLDPTRDYLVILFPLGFWFDVTMLVVLLTLAEISALGVGGWFVRKVVR